MPGTTPSRSSNAPPTARHRMVLRGPSDRLVGAALLGLVGLAAAYGWPMAAARLAELPGDGATALLYAGERPTEEGYVRLLDSREAALTHRERAGPHRDLGHAYYVLADEFAQTEEGRRELLARAVRELRAAAARSPADPAVLAMIAAAHLAAEEDAQAASWLATAQRIAPYHPETAFIRIWVALTVGADRADGSRPAFARDLRAAFGRDRQRTVNLLIDLDADRTALDAAESLDEEFRYELGVALMRAREALADEAEPTR